jgi:hypothetical protein
MKIVIPEVREISLKDVRKFICEGKRNGWASGKEPEITWDAKRYTYVRDGIIYEDKFRGDEGIIGTEIVSFIGRDIWGMNYSDTFRLPQDFPREEAEHFKRETMKFLKECLLQVPEDFPFRGPVNQVKKEIMGRELTYVNVPITMRDHPTTAYVGGDFILREFQGVESILMEPCETGKKDTIVFNLDYHGRILVPDSYIRE